MRTEINIHLTVEKIKKESPLLAAMESDGRIKIVGGLYVLETGKVTFY